MQRNIPPPLFHITSSLLALLPQLSEGGEACGGSPQGWLLLPSVSWPQLWVSKERIAIPVPIHLTSHHPRRIFCQALLPAHLDTQKKRTWERIFHSSHSESSSTQACTAVTKIHTHTHTHTHIHTSTYSFIIRCISEEHIHLPIQFCI